MSKKARRVHPGLRRSSAQAKHRTRRANTADQVAARQLVIGSKLEPPPGGKWVSHWDGIIQSYETEPSAEAQAFEAAIDAGVAAFGTQKDNLLAVLLNAYERGPKSKPFHADSAWDRLERMAWLYFWRKRLEHKGRPARDRSKRLRKIANVLGKACRLFDEAKQMRSSITYTRLGATKMLGMTLSRRGHSCSFASRTSLIKSSQLCPL